MISRCLNIRIQDAEVSKFLFITIVIDIIDYLLAKINVCDDDRNK